MKRLMVLSNYFFPTKGGVARFATEVCKHLREFGYSVVVISEDIGDRQCDEYCDELIAYRGFRRLPSVISTIFRNINCILSIAVNFRRDDKVLVITWRTFGTICWGLRIPYALVAHGSEFTYADSVKGIPFANWLKKAVITRAKVVLCNSQYTEKVVKGISCNAKTRVVGCGVSIDYWESISPVAPIQIQEMQISRYIISVGALTKRKGFDYLVSAFAKSTYSTDGFLVIATPGGDWDFLKRSIEMEGVSEKVVVFTGIGDAELAYLYQKADLFAMLNYNFRGDYEGFGIVFLEASYFGLPVIGGLDGGSRDAILEGETGYLVDPLQSSEKIVGYLNRLHDDSGLRRQLGRAGCDYVKSSNSWAHVAERIHFAMSHI